MKRISFLNILLFTSLLCFGCKGSTDEKIDGPELIPYTIFINYSGRMASPGLDTLADINFTVYAQQGNEDITVTEPITKDDNLTYRMLMSPGNWDIEVIGKRDDKSILFGETSVTVSINGSYECSVPVYFIDNDTESELENFGNSRVGSINLEIDVTGTEIDYLMISGDDIPDSIKGPKNTPNQYKKTDDKIIISCSNVAVGDYPLVFTFYNEKGISLVSMPETINVRYNIETNKWITNGYSAWLQPIELENNPNNRKFSKFVLSPAVITLITNTYFYVDSTSVGKDTNAGNSIEVPFKTLQYAIDTIISRNKTDSSSEEHRNYYLYICNNIGSASASFSIEPEEDLNLTILSNSEDSDNIPRIQSQELTINEHANVTFSNIELRGKGEILVKEKGSITLSEGTFVNNSTGYLETIHLYDNAKLKIKNLTSFEDYKINLKTENPVIGDDIVLKLDENDSEIPFTDDEAKQFVLNNPGYYCELNENNKSQMIVKGSQIVLHIPEIGKVKLHLYINDDELDTTNGKISLTAAQTASTIKAKITDINDNEVLDYAGQPVSPAFNYYLYIEDTEIAKNTSALTKPSQGLPLSGKISEGTNYLLKVSFEYNQELYGDSFILKVQE